MKPNLDNVDIEFKDLVAIPDDNGLLPMEVDIANPPEEYVQAGELDDFVKIFSQGKLQKRSRLEPARTAPPEDEPAEEQSCEEFFSCEKQSSSPNKIKLFKRMVDGELLIEGFDHEGTCVMTRVVPAGAEISEGEPLAKAAITSSMHATLSKLRTSLTAKEFAAAERAIKALDIACFLEIVRRAQVAS